MHGRTAGDDRPFTGSASSPLFEHACQEEQGYVWWILPRALERAQDRRVRVDFGCILLDPVILSDLD